MGPDKLDDFIKKQVGEHMTPNDPDLLWQKIQVKQEEEKKDKRRFLYVWWFGGASLLLGFVLLYVFQFEKSDRRLAEHQQPKVNQEIVASTPLNEQATTKENLEKQSSTKTEKNTDHILPSAGLNNGKNENLQTTNTPTTSIDSPPSIASPSSDNTKPTKINDNSKTTTTKTANAKISATDFDHSEKANTIIPNPREPGKSSESGEPIEPREPNESSLLENNFPTPITAEEVKDKMETPKALVEKVESTAINTVKDIPILAEKELLPHAEKTEMLKVLQIDSVSVAQQEESTDSMISQQTQEVKGWRFSNGVAFTYGKALRTLSDRTSSPSTYLEARKNMETPLDAVRINLDFRAEHPSGFYLKSGLDYEQINERFDSYIEWDSIIVDPNRLLAIAYDANGVASERRGSGDVKSIHWLRKKIYNRYRSIDVPLLVGYHSKKADKRLGWFVEAGASMNVWFAASGEILGANNEYLSLGENADLFKTQTGISLLGTAGLSYQLAPQFSVWLSPDVKYHWSSISSSQNSIDQKYLNVGVRLGARYHWAKK